MDDTIRKLAHQAGIYVSNRNVLDEYKVACNMRDELLKFINEIREKAKEAGVAASFAKMEYQINMHSMSPTEVAVNYDRQKKALRVFKEYIKEYHMLVKTHKWWVDDTKRIKGMMIGLLDGVYQSRPTPLAEIDYLFQGHGTDISGIVGKIF